MVTSFLHVCVFGRIKKKWPSLLLTPFSLIHQPRKKEGERRRRAEGKQSEFEDQNSSHPENVWVLPFSFPSLSVSPPPLEASGTSLAPLISSPLCCKGVQIFGNLLIMLQFIWALPEGWRARTVEKLPRITVPSQIQLIPIPPFRWDPPHSRWDPSYPSDETCCPLSSPLSRFYKTPGPSAFSLRCPSAFMNDLPLVRAWIRSPPSLPSAFLSDCAAHPGSLKQNHKHIWS